MNVFGRKVIGVLGGMGPSATARFYQLIIKNCQKAGLKDNGDYPHIIIYSLPVPDLISDQEKEDVTLRLIITALKKLELFGCNFIVIPCNTIHLYIELFRKSVKIPIISIIEETVNKVNYKTVGVLGTKTTIYRNLYQSKLEAKGIRCIIPKNIEILSVIIKKIISGEIAQDDKEFVVEEIKQMKEAEAVILGCTELPLIISQKDVNIQVFDTLEILAERTVMEVLR